jgi:predicted dehydrogenase
MGMIMSKTKLRAAVIGGGLGGSHGYAYARAEEYELVAVCDINPEVFDRFYERAEIARGGIGEYADYREMFAKENVDVVSVATPDHLHVDPVCDASDAGIRGILCEKPLATTLADADRIVETIERNGTKLSVDHTRSWIPSHQAVREAIRDGEIGPLTRIVAHMGGKRSMLFRNGTHLVDAVCFFADAEPVWVIAAHERGFEDYGPVYDGKGGKNPQYDPGSTIIVEFANGVRGMINAAKLTPQMFEFDLQGPGGRYWLTDQQCTFWKTEQPEGRAELTDAPEGRGYADPFGENLIPAVQELARMISDDVPSSSPAQRGRHTLEIMLAALKSQVEGSAKIQLPLPRG